MSKKTLLKRRGQVTPRKNFLVLLPRHTPSLNAMLEDIGTPSLSVVAKVLGVHVRTVERWVAADCAPRAALLALFYATRWGQSLVHTQAHNDAVLQAHIARNLLERLDNAERQLAKLGQIGEFGTANDPAPGVQTYPLQPPHTGIAAAETSSETSATSQLIRDEIMWFARVN